MIHSIQIGTKLKAVVGEKETDFMRLFPFNPRPVGFSGCLSSRCGVLRSPDTYNQRSEQPMTPSQLAIVCETLALPAFSAAFVERHAAQRLDSSPPSGSWHGVL